MSRGWEFIYELERREAEASASWWARYADRLTPEERKRIRGGVYNAFWRSFRPAFAEGAWLDAAPGLCVRVASVELRRGRWRCCIDRVQDFRPPPSESVRGAATYASLDNVETLVPFAHRESDPERVLPADSAKARLKAAQRIKEAIRG